MRSLLASLLLVAVVLGIVAFSPAQADAAWWRNRAYYGSYYPGYSTPYVSSYYTPSYSSYYYTPSYSSYYYTPSYSSYSAPLYDYNRVVLTPVFLTNAYLTAYPAQSFIYGSPPPVDVTINQPQQTAPAPVNRQLGFLYGLQVIAP